MAVAEVDYLNGGGGNVTVESLIPPMTSATAPSGSVTASGYYSSNYPYLAFDERNEGVDGGGGNGWALSGNQSGASSNQWLQYEFPTAVKAKFARIFPFYASSYLKNRTRQYKYQASTTGAFTGEEKDLTETLTFGENDFYARIDNFTKNVGEYKYYRLCVISSGSNEGCGCNALQLYTY